MPGLWPFTPRRAPTLPTDGRAWLQYILSRTGFRIGMRALFAPCDEPSWALCLHQLGWETTCLAPDWPIVSSLREATGQPSSVRLANPAGRLAFDERLEAITEPDPLRDAETPGSFDLIVMEPYTGEESLLSSTRRLQTAHWLSLLNPGGYLVIPRIIGAADDEHGPDCYFRHLACFPGEVRNVTDQSSLWNSVLIATGLRSEETPQAQWTHMILQSPATTHSLALWQQYVARGLQTGQTACCPLARQALPARQTHKSPETLSDFPREHRKAA